MDTMDRRRPAFLIRAHSVPGMPKGVIRASSLDA